MRHARSVQLAVRSPAPQPPPTPSPLDRPAAGRRFLVAHLPCFRLERCGWQADDLAVLVAEEKSALRVQAGTLAAAREGLRRGMTVSEARAMCPDVRVELAEPPEVERADLHDLARLFERLSPNLRALPPQAIAVELTARLKGGEPAALRRARALLEDLGHACRVVIADDIRGALALAAWWPDDAPLRDTLVPPGALAEALAALPVAALGPSPSLLDRLELLGLRRVEDLARLDAASLSGRFGVEGLHLHRLARGVPADDPLDPPPPPGALTLRRQLPDPTADLGAVLHVFTELCERLCVALRAREQAAVRLQLRLTLEDAEPFSLPLRLGTPRRDPRALVDLAHKRLERVKLEGAVEGLTLEVLEACPFLGQQQGLLDRSGAQEPLDELLARLSDALGEAALYCPALEPRHRPELSWAARAPSPRAMRRGSPPLSAPAPRPAMLLREPQPLRVRLGADGRPRAVEVDQHWREARAARGPERLVGEWWTEAAFDRDYFRVELEDGRALWLFHDRVGGDWWLHGLWD
ncbi:MAG: hypothetical protein H6739_01720 [Alphaproteobacteria bacterium]|nr:hypothetical protein [Alphaproteobacteria bacterium]